MSKTGRAGATRSPMRTNPHREVSARHGTDGRLVGPDVSEQHLVWWRAVGPQWLGALPRKCVPAGRLSRSALGHRAPGPRSKSVQHRSSRCTGFLPGRPGRGGRGLGVPPGRQPLRGVPVDPDVALSGVAAQQHLPEVLHLRGVGMGVVGHGARHHLGGSRTGEPQELVDLMTGDVGDDPAEPIMIVEPVRAPGSPCQMAGIYLAVRAQPQRLHNLTYTAGANEFASPGHATDLEPLGESHRPKPTRLGHGILDLLQLLVRNTTWFVGDDILAVA